MLIEKYLRKIHRVYSYIYGKAAYACSFVTPLPPSKLHFLITSRCNLKCHFCYCADNLNQIEPNILTAEDWEKIGKNIGRGTAIIFTGGEAFLYPHLYKALSILFARKRMVSITTNGVSIDVDKLFATNPRSMFVMMFSIHGPEKIHDEITGVPGSYQKAIGNIKKIDEYKRKNNFKYPILSVKAVICEENADSMIGFVKEIEKLPICHLYFNLLTKDSLHHSLETYQKVHYDKLEEKPYYEYPPEIKEKVIKLIEFIKEHQSPIDIGFTDIFKNNDELLGFVNDPSQFKVAPCLRPWHEMLVYNDGEFGNCLGYNSGNLKDYNYNVRKIFQARRYKEFLKHFKSKGKVFNACYACKEAVFSRK